MIRLRRIGGLAALTYAAFAAVEGMNVLDVPMRSEPASRIAAFYASPRALLILPSVLGALALFAYCVFVAGMWSQVRDDPWAVVGLIGGIGGPAVAAPGLAMHALLVSHGGRVLGPDAMRTLFEGFLLTRTLAAGFMALTLTGFGVAGIRTRAIPKALGWAGVAFGPYLLGVTSAAFTIDHTAQRLVLVGFGAHALWVFATGTWMVLRAGEVSEAGTFVRRSAFLVLVLAAGISGIGLLAFPDSTDRFFSWGLHPAPLASLIGGFYVASSIAFAAGWARRGKPSGGSSWGP